MTWTQTKTHLRQKQTKKPSKLFILLIFLDVIVCSMKYGITQIYYIRFLTVDEIFFEIFT